MRVFVAGSSGNVGRVLVRALMAADDMEICGGFALEDGVDLGLLAGVHPIGIRASSDLPKALEESNPDAVVDFTSSRIVRDNVGTYLEMGFDCVLGTTGLSPKELEQLEREVRERGLRWAAIPNFALGPNLIAAVLSKISRFYPYACVVDRHPAGMANAPSGTSLMLSRAIGAKEGKVASEEVIPGVLGGEEAGVRIHSERLPYPGPYSEHEVVLAREDEVLRIRVTCFSSQVYVDGVLATLRRIKELPKGSFVRSLSEILDLREG